MRPDAVRGNRSLQQRITIGRGFRRKLGGDLSAATTKKPPALNTVESGNVKWTPFVKAQPEISTADEPEL